jgi:hypothetical protein
LYRFQDIRRILDYVLHSLKYSSLKVIFSSVNRRKSGGGRSGEKVDVKGEELEVSPRTLHLTEAVCAGPAVLWHCHIATLPHCHTATFQVVLFVNHPTDISKPHIKSFSNRLASRSEFIVNNASMIEN